MNFIKTLTVVFMLTSLTAYSQFKRDFSGYWVGNLPTSPLGLGFNFAKKENKFGVFNYYVSPFNCYKAPLYRFQPFPAPE